MGLSNSNTCGKTTSFPNTDTFTNENVDKYSIIQKSILNLFSKIQNANTSEEKRILNKQLDELNKINFLYENIKNNNLITFQTKKEIKLIINKLKNHNNISYTKNKINNLLDLEKEKFKDTIDIFSPNTIRDFIENNIKLIGKTNNLLKEQFNYILDLISVTYINFIEKSLNRKINKNEINLLIENEGLFLTKKEVHSFLVDLLKKIKQSNNPLVIDFNFTIKLKKNNSEETLLINLKQYNDQLKINKIKKEESRKQKEESRKQKEESRKQKEDGIKGKNNSIQIFEKKLLDISTKERIKYIETIMDNEEFKPYLLSVIQKMQGTHIYLGKGKKVVFNKEYIQNNEVKLLKNLKTIILLIIEIESDGLPTAENKNSTAEGIGQWLSGNGRMSKEYMYNRKWYSKIIKNKKYSIERDVWLTSSFETTLKNIKLNYPDTLLKDLDFLPNTFRKKTNIHPLDLNLREQIKIMILDLGSNNKKVRNGKGNLTGELIGIKDYLGTALIGNKRATKEIYKIFHHTKPDKKTLKRINHIMDKYDDHLNKIK